MNRYQEFTEQDGFVRRYEYDDGTVLMADLGSAADGSVDIVDGAAIVVIGDEQYEFDVPEGATEAVINNGVLTIEVKR